jgi:hypothetical protein
MKIGQLVRSKLADIWATCEADPGELQRLLDPRFSNATLRLNFPFCWEASSISSAENVRYWSQEHRVAGTSVRVTSQWFEGRHRAPFCQYLLSRSLIDTDEFEVAMVAPDGSAPLSVPSPRAGERNSRFRSTAPGDAQNAVVRVILSRIGQESFNRHDWAKAKDHFDGRCAYCNSLDAFDVDHAISINRTSLGEHRLGNMIPSCKPCNSAKGQMDYVTFLGADRDRIDRIASYMATMNYTPLGTNEAVRDLLAAAYEEVGKLIGRYAEEINSALAVGQEER